MDKRVFSVLVIDNEPAVLKSIQLYLRSSDFKLSMTTEPKVGLEMARALLPDVILCDAVMPDLSGVEVIAMLKDDPATAGIPVVLITAVAEAHLSSDVAWTGFLAKPFSAKELQEALVSAVKTGSAGREEGNC